MTLTLRAWRVLLRLALVGTVVAAGATGASLAAGEYVYAGAGAIVAVMLGLVVLPVLADRVADVWAAGQAPDVCACGAPDSEPCRPWC